jgi:cytochrome c556
MENVDMRKSVIALAAVIALGSASTAFARDPIKSAIKARKSAFILIATNLGPMGAMAKGKIPFNKDKFTLRAVNLEALSKMPWEFFIPNSQKGSEAKPAVWEKADDFKSEADVFKMKVADLAKASRSGDEEAMKMTFRKVANTCKSCHKEYKEK